MTEICERSELALFDSLSHCPDEPVSLEGLRRTIGDTAYNRFLFKHEEPLEPIDLD